MGGNPCGIARFGRIYRFKLKSPQLVLQSGAGECPPVRVEFINPFVSAAYHVLEFETKSPVTKGELRLEEAYYTSKEITALIGVVGKVSGTVLYGMDERTAKLIASANLGQTVAIFDQLTESAVGELANMITGRASALLEEAGYPCIITPPTMIIGRGTIISTSAVQRLVIPLLTKYGELSIAVALKETPHMEIKGIVADPRRVFP